MQNFLIKHKYAILLSGALIQVFTGVPAAWGVFQSSVCEGYKLESHNATLIFSFTIFFFGIGGVIGGYMQDKKGPRMAGVIGSILLSIGYLLSAFMPPNYPWVLYLTFSLPIGLGISFLNPAVMSCVQKWYSDKKGFATGVIGVSVGFSGAVLTFFVNFFNKYEGIRTSFFALGIITAFVSGIACLFLENPKNKQEIKNKMENKSLTPKQMLKSKQYWLLTIAVLCAAPAMILFSPLIIEIALNRGLSQELALSCVAIGSVFSAAGRLCMPWLSDKIGRGTVLIILFSSLILCSIVFIYAQNLFVLIIYCFLAFSYSGQAAVIPCTVTELFGEKMTGINYGLVTLGMSGGSLIFPYLANYFNSEIGKNIIAITSSIFGLFLIILLNKTNKNNLLSS